MGLSVGELKEGKTQINSRRPGDPGCFLLGRDSSCDLSRRPDEKSQTRILLCIYDFPANNDDDADDGDPSLARCTAPPPPQTPPEGPRAWNSLTPVGSDGGEKNGGDKAREKKLQNKPKNGLDLSPPTTDPDVQCRRPHLNHGTPPF